MPAQKMVNVPFTVSRNVAFFPGPAALLGKHWYVPWSDPCTLFIVYRPSFVSLFNTQPLLLLKWYSYLSTGGSAPVTAHVKVTGSPCSAVLGELVRRVPSGGSAGAVHGRVVKAAGVRHQLHMYVT